MSKAQKTQTKLLTHARQLFWARGFSNVPLREIAGVAGVDVALISRYFGSKIGLFEATLADLPTLDPAVIRDCDALIDIVVQLFTSATRGGPDPSTTSLILLNADDAEVGAVVRQSYDINWQRPLNEIIGDTGKAALFSAAMFGMSVAEKTMKLDGIAAPQSKAYEKQLRAMLSAALAD